MLYYLYLVHCTRAAILRVHRESDAKSQDSRSDKNKNNIINLLMFNKYINNYYS